MHDPNPVLFMEHKHLYRRVKGEVPEGRYETPFTARVAREGTDLVVIAYGAMVHTALEATEDLDGASVEVLDLRSLVPLDEEAILASVRKCSKVVIVDEANHTCAAGAQVAALIAERGWEDLDGPVRARRDAGRADPVLPARSSRRSCRRSTTSRRRAVSSSPTEGATLVDVTMPQMGVSVAEGTVVEWRKQVGDWVQRDEIICAISTDKIDTDVESPATGRVGEIVVQVGETVDVGTVLARIATDARPGEAHRSENSHQGNASAGAGAAATGTGEATAALEAPGAAGELQGDTTEAVNEGSAQAAAGRRGAGGARRYSPVVRRIAAEHGIDLDARAGHRPRRAGAQAGRAGRPRRRRHSGGGARAADAHREPVPARCPGPAAPARAALRGGRRSRRPRRQRRRPPSRPPMPGPCTARRCRGCASRSARHMLQSLQHGRAPARR